MAPTALELDELDLLLRCRPRHDRDERQVEQPREEGLGHGGGARRGLDQGGALARETGGHFLDQFTYAERATDWRGNNNIAESIFSQLAHERHPVPTWVVVGAGTGGTSATIGRFIRYRRHDTRLCVVDPENSAFFRGWSEDDPSATGSGSRIEGIGRPRVEPSTAS